jgi:hypothetical protein
MEIRIAIQAESKFSQIRQSPAKAEQRKSKKKALISFDFLVRIEPFQRVMLTPWAKKFFCLSFPTHTHVAAPSFYARVAARRGR